MTNYLIRRGFQMGLVVMAATIAIFILLNAIPGGPLTQLPNADPNESPTEEEIARQERLLGINRPIYLAYLTWMLGEDWLDEVGDALGNPKLNDRMTITETWSDFQTPTCAATGGTNQGAKADISPCSRGIVRGDLGESWALASGQPVVKVLGSRIWNTLRLSATASLLSLLVALPIGIISAVKQYSKLDYVVTSFSFFGISMPSFWFGLLLIILQLWLMNNGLPFLPTGNVVDLRVIPGSVNDLLNISPGSTADYIIHLILPVMMLSLLTMAGWSRFMRSSMLEVLRQDFVRTARAKGLHERMVIVKHAARNALIPLITIVVFQIPGIFGGAIITETIFNYPGMGRLFITALNASDWPIIMAILFISAILVVLATLIGDVLYTMVDPRIRFEQ